MTPTSPARPLLIALLGAAALAALLVVPGFAPPTEAQPANPALADGARYFDDAIRWVARGNAAIPTVSDFYVNLDAKLDLDAQRHEGLMRVWYKQPDKYRQELTTNNATTTKILNGDVGWIVTPNGRVQNLALSAEGQQSIAQLREDRDRLGDITQFLTLEGLKGPGVTFTFEGFKRGSGTYAGDWIKVTRRAEGRANIVFWLAYERDPQTGRHVATWPGIVRVEGDPAQGFPTEDYILRDWDHPQSQRRSFRYPRRIEAYSILSGPDGRPTPTRFLAAIVDDIKINAGIDDARFRPPSGR